MTLPRQFTYQHSRPRHRMTPAIARTESNEILVENFEQAQAVLSGKQEFPLTVKMRAKRVHGIIRAELLKRGFEREAIDYKAEEPESVAQ